MSSPPELIRIASTAPDNPSQLRANILRGLSTPEGYKSLPTTILYDERGLELYDDITMLAGEHYYLFPCEEHILKHHAQDIVNVMCARNALDDTNNAPGALALNRGVLLELGSGSLRKTAHLISALSAAVSNMSQNSTPTTYTYYALDLAPASLTQSLKSLASIAGGNILLKGLVTDYESGLNWVREGGLDEPRQPQGSLPEARINTDLESQSSAEYRVVINKNQAADGDLEHKTRGRLPRHNPLLQKKENFPHYAGKIQGGADDDFGVTYQHDVPLIPRTLTPTVLPEEDERVSNPKCPETLPHSRSRDYSLSGLADGYDRDVLRAPYLADDLSSITTDAPSMSVSVDNSRSDIASENGDTRSGSRPRHKFQAQNRTRATPPGESTPEWEHGSPPLHLLFLGSSLGNFDRSGSAKFLRSLPLRPGSSDTLLLGLDGRNEKTQVEKAYNDPDGYTTKFILNGLNVVTKALGLSGDEANLIDKFEYVGVYNEELGRHEAYFEAKEAFPIHPYPMDPISFKQGELVNVEYSYKYSDSDAYAMFAESNLRPITRWQDPDSLYSLWLLERPAFAFPRLIHPSVADDTMAEFKEYSSPISAPPEWLESDDRDKTRSLSVTETRAGAFGTPSLSEYQEIWKLWDEITLGMIPKHMLNARPIHLRHVCLFYLGHIPAFLDIHLSKLLNEPPTEPEYFKDIFERGIDPTVDNPTDIHPHSVVPESPEDWPPLDSILLFRDRVRERLARLYDCIERGDKHVLSLGRKVGRVLWMCLEHEGWHAETLLYMLIQRAGSPGGTLPPRGFAPPAWMASSVSISTPLIPDASNVSRRPRRKDLLLLNDQVFTVGHDDYELEDAETPLLLGAAKEYRFGWDNEHPRRQVSIYRPVLVEKLCITNAEYLTYFRASLEESKNIEVPASWVVAEDCSVHFKVRTLYGPVSFSVGGDWPFVGSYDQIESFAKWKGGRILDEVELRAFIDQYLNAENTPVGFKEWTFVPGLAPQPDKGQRGHNGGVWEWSSTPMDVHEGYIPSRIYPGYSSDFFDGLHHIVLGGSFATIPRISQRRTVRNFYQHNYPYAWVAGRVAYDA